MLSHAPDVIDAEVGVGSIDWSSPLGVSLHWFGVRGENGHKSSGLRPTSGFSQAIAPELARG